MASAATITCTISREVPHLLLHSNPNDNNHSHNNYSGAKRPVAAVAHTTAGTSGQCWGTHMQSEPARNMHPYVRPWLHHLDSSRTPRFNTAPNHMYACAG